MTKTLTVKEAAERLGVSTNRVTVLITTGRLPATKPGRDWVIEERHLKMVANRPTGRPPQKN